MFLVSEHVALTLSSKFLELIAFEEDQAKPLTYTYKPEVYHRLLTFQTPTRFIASGCFDLLIFSQGLAAIFFQP